MGAGPSFNYRAEVSDSVDNVSEAHPWLLTQRNVPAVHSDGVGALQCAVTSVIPDDCISRCYVGNVYIFLRKQHLTSAIEISF